VPSDSGIIYPARRDGFGPAAGGGDVHVTVEVRGTVIAERDLAERVRAELLKLKRRNTSIGL
jgi:hypothetical protein